MEDRHQSHRVRAEGRCVPGLRDRAPGMGHHVSRQLTSSMAGRVVEVGQVGFTSSSSVP